MGLQAEARAAREGRITHEEFLRRSSDDWERISRYAMRRYHLRGRVDPADFMQDVMLGAWRALVRFDPKKADPKWLAHYVTFGAIAQAIRPHRRVMQGRAPTLVDVDGLLGARAPRTPAVAEQRILGRERVAAAVAGDAARRTAVEAFASTGCVALAAELVYENPSTRHEGRYTCREHARKEVRRHVREVAALVDFETQKEGCAA